MSALNYLIVSFKKNLNSKHDCDCAFSIGMSMLKPSSRSVELERSATCIERVVSEPLSRFVGLARPATCTRRVVRRGVCRLPLRCLSQFISYEREIDQLLMVL